MSRDVNDINDTAGRAYRDELLQRAQDTSLREVTPGSARSLGLVPSLERPKILMCPLREDGREDAILKVGVIDMKVPGGACAYTRSEHSVIIASGGKTCARYFAVQYWEMPKAPN